MLTAIEKEGFKQILRKLSEDEVHSLKDTVTKKQIITKGKIEGIDAIITFTESAVELLKRKKVKRDILFKYLADQEVTVSVGAEKHQLIKKILTFWGSKFNNAEIEESISLETVTESRSDHIIATSNRRASPVPSDRSVNFSHGDHRSILHTTTETSSQVSSTTCDTTDVAVYPDRSNNTVSLQSAPDEKFDLGKQFIQWFYKMLNSHNPSLQDFPDGEFGSQHFWSDCHLEMQFSVQGEVNIEHFEGSAMVAQRFLALVKEERLLFNPNLNADGIKVKSEPHGLVMVMTCGTIHRVSDCLGMFEQVFGLVSDPTLDNNWKVKMSQLRIKSSQHPTMPKLDGGETVLAIACSSSSPDVGTSLTLYSDSGAAT